MIHPVRGLDEIPFGGFEAILDVGLRVAVAIFSRYAMRLSCLLILYGAHL